MTTRVLLRALLLPLTLVTSAPALGATRHLTASGNGLGIDSPCARQVSIMPDATGGDITVDATADNQPEVDQLVLTGGESVKLFVPSHGPNSCWRPAGSPGFAPTLALAIHVPPSSALSIDESGKADYTVGDIHAPLNLDFSGMVNMRAEGIGALNLDLSGAGDVAIARANGPVHAELSGHGTLTIDNASISAASLDLSGNGSIRIDHGDIGNIQISDSGAADVLIGATVGNGAVDISGVGAVKIAKVTGALAKDVSGAGSIEIGNQ
jgi:hypothetical protein